MKEHFRAKGQKNISSTANHNLGRHKEAIFYHRKMSVFDHPHYMIKHTTWPTHYMAKRMVILNDKKLSIRLQNVLPTLDF